MSDSTIGGLIRGAAAGDGRAADELFSALYAELHAIAERQLRGGEFTLGTTTLLHEAYLSISAREGLEFAGRNQFLAYAARAMRGLTIDHYRRRRRRKRGGGLEITALDEVPAAEPETEPENLERLSAALDALAQVDAPLAELVDLHFFAGFTHEEIAAMRNVSERTVQRDWRKARLMLFDAINRA